MLRRQLIPTAAVLCVSIRGCSSSEAPSLLTNFEGSWSRQPEKADGWAQQDDNRPSTQGNHGSTPHTREWKQENRPSTHVRSDYPSGGEAGKRRTRGTSSISVIPTNQPKLRLSPAALIEGMTHFGLNTGEIAQDQMVKGKVFPLRLSGTRFYGVDEKALLSVMQRRGIDNPFWLTAYELASVRSPGTMLKLGAEWVPLPSTLGVQIGQPPEAALTMHGDPPPQFTATRFEVPSTVYVINASDTTRLHLFHSATCQERRVPTGFDGMPLGHSMPHVPKRLGLGQNVDSCLAWLRQPYPKGQSFALTKDPGSWRLSFDKYLKGNARGLLRAEGQPTNLLGSIEALYEDDEPGVDSSALGNHFPLADNTDASPPDPALRHLIAQGIEVASAASLSKSYNKAFEVGTQVLSKLKGHSPYFIPLWLVKMTTGVAIAPRATALSFSLNPASHDQRLLAASGVQMTRASFSANGAERTLYVNADETNQSTAFGPHSCIPYFPTIITVSCITAPYLAAQSGQAPELVRVVRTTLVRDLASRLKLSHEPQSYPAFVDAMAIPLLQLQVAKPNPHLVGSPAALPSVSDSPITEAAIAKHLRKGMRMQGKRPSDMVLLNAAEFSSPEAVDMLCRYTPLSLAGMPIINIGTFNCTEPSPLNLDKVDVTHHYQLEDSVYAAYVAITNGYRSDAPWVTATQAEYLGLRWSRPIEDLPVLSVLMPVKDTFKISYYCLQEAEGFNDEMIVLAAKRFLDYRNEMHQRKREYIEGTRAPFKRFQPHNEEGQVNDGDGSSRGSSNTLTAPPPPPPEEQDDAFYQN